MIPKLIVIVEEIQFGAMKNMTNKEQVYQWSNIDNTSNIDYDILFPLQDELKPE